ncbi:MULTISPECIES: branched-chain amino acid transport system II carrier protein [unclassified Exiguobacterium]|uniref:branched-chain amino acid transport system II carrier protein n=1 Tax=unclassified Exiguobacterium TaxID=2644629 RepID=UPI00103FAEF9|nr:MULTISPECIES: branched-chain amino acid transport system II carrier protein [unclassified Exiguobacterium]TCI39388.1 branched-chain amino acid transport system II carrier protein [Exiguobacterium sp. SH4S7]TCI47916.1 branched-chain amino acid transport system II carrier protein [Exiguobacterium sp. SH5S32]TCI54800.1 branched-chain amino acid transport system II carrier protein [Exiguobacterium sp. SH1S4]TCI61651.1 branched-chain amino acid transport system II carrier protein [Exiguobacterium
MKKSTLFPLAFTIFALFFGAGNLLFPPMLGALAGENLFPALVGFVITGVGLPLLALFAVARVGGGSDQIAQYIPKRLALLLTGLMYVAIGPFFGIPRTAAVTYEMGVVPFLGAPSTFTLAISSTVFFGLTFLLTLRAQKLIEIIGRIITPILLVLLAGIGITNLVAPLGSPVAPAAGYETWLGALGEGFKQGYLTMDVFGALVFGAIVLVTLKANGMSDQKEASSLLRTSGLLAVTCLMLVYISLASIGANMTGVTGTTDGASLLQTFAGTSFGQVGMLALGAAVFLACLTTAVGLISEFSRFMSNTFESLKYYQVVIGTTLFGYLISLVGLGTLIEIAIPLLTLLYPVMIALVLVSVTERIQRNPQVAMKATVYTALVFSLFETAQGLAPTAVTAWITNLPMAEIGLAWAVPTLIVYVVTLFLPKQRSSGSLAESRIS